MSITSRPYERAKDFERVGMFLDETYDGWKYPGNWLRLRWEYMHFHTAMDVASLDKIRLWEDAGDIVGVVHYESELGYAYFQVRGRDTKVKAEMLDHAIEYLCRKVGSRRRLVAWINEIDPELERLASERGFKKDPGHPEPQTSMPIPKPFPKIMVPDGYRLQSLAEGCDLAKVHRVLHRGFNHPGEPPADGLEGRKLMMSAPSFRKDLNIVAVAPNGDYVSYGGMWFDPLHKIAFVEPVATDPEYRMMGLGKAVVMESIRRCAKLGAKTAFVGSNQTFYMRMGFKLDFNTYPWIWMSKP